MVEIEKVSINIQFDNGPVPYRIGLIVLNTDETTERDYQRMLPADGDVMYYTTRVQTVNPVTISNLRKMSHQLSGAASLLLPDVALDVITYSCTSGALAIGYDEVVDQIRAGGRSDIQVVTPLTAASEAFKTLGIKSISLLTPYIDSVTQLIREYIEHEGVLVLNTKSFYVENDVDIARLNPTDIKAAALETFESGADALFLSCTALRAADVLQNLEDELGIPVLSSNQCTFWQALRSAGYTRPIKGFGRLLAQ